MAFHTRLKELREKAKMTQGELAERSGVSKASISNLEQDRYAPTWEIVQKLVDALPGASCEDFKEPAPEVKPAKGKKKGGK